MMTVNSVWQETDIAVYNPANTHSIELYFRGEKMAKVCSWIKLSYSLLNSFSFSHLNIIS